MYRISELGQRVSLARSTLLYYEKLGLIEASRDGNGYRAFSEEQLQRLKLVQQLLAAGLSLKEARRCLQGQLPKNDLVQKLTQLDLEIAAKQQARTLLAALLGCDDVRLRSWHQQLAREAPKAHLNWLQQQGFSEKDAQRLQWLSKDMHDHESYMNDFERIFAGLEHWGPGSEASSLRALKATGQAPRKILDIGCGTGAASLLLAAHTQAEIVALDNDRHALSEVERRAKAQGLDDRVRTCCASMTALPFAPASFDLIWSEASAYILGVADALKAWQPLLQPQGYLVISDLVWTQDHPPAAQHDFWQQEYPDMQRAEVRIEQAEQAGFIVRDQFLLDDTAWRKYHAPLRARVEQLEPEMQGSRAIADLKTELEFLEGARSHFGYLVLVLQKR